MYIRLVPSMRQHSTIQRMHENIYIDLELEARFLFKLTTENAYKAARTCVFKRTTDAGTCAFIPIALARQ